MLPSPLRCDLGIRTAPDIDASCRQSRAFHGDPHYRTCQLKLLHNAISNAGEFGRELLGGLQGQSARHCVPSVPIAKQLLKQIKELTKSCCLEVRSAGDGYRPTASASAGAHLQDLAAGGMQQALA